MTKELHRKIWVKRPGASPTLVQIRENDLMDGVREMILKKYANSLGRYFDAPDITLRIVARDDPSLEQTLGPDEEICRTLDTYYPGGQTVDEALIIDVPHRRTPRQSPRPTQIVYYDDQSRPFEHGGDYFPPMPPNVPSPAAITSTSHESRHSRDLSLSQTHSNHSHSHSLGHSSFDQTRSMTVLSTGQVPPLPSPGGTRRSHLTRPGRPANVRQPTASPTALANPHRSSRPHDSGDLAPAPAIISTPPTEHPPTAAQPTSRPTTPRVSSPRPKGRRRMRLRPDGTNSAATTPAPMSLSIPTIETSVPPINVLIVEDNHINLKLLEQFIRRLKVRWASAQNGREAVNKWRTGGFHLVLMDIQLPIMSGLEATKEIRRLERVNGIGVLANSTPTPGEEKSEGDKLVDRSLFKSPVIIVALTASNLQSDRHEALAAGCNDFLTKPVNFVWLERKVKEWGCMQALIDFDGWRKWKDFSQNDEGAEKKKEEK
ncbi:CheY-like protein [Eremomyces bilateralis CBS 781.70]|uniref:CheY-like protein n=1 Tax=Eremomyces bilateralis CBS 781.70 TaxID=1392243 RepID=A0A6G1FYU9_9PEZI|nr:CheY-like protein [Eremomyces bilateralis CBS 781.70]KAF1810870.1 CheY-like protein [Eremomyces bilateralis CBS 781.70]